MTTHSLRHIPAGEAIPDSVHGISVSIPTLEYVIRYEQRDKDTLRAISRGYPRFRVHPYVARVATALQTCGGARELLLTCSPRASRHAAAYAHISPEAVFHTGGVDGVSLPADAERAGRARAFVQHTGCHLSSRQAEQFLLHANLIQEPQRETRAPQDAERRIAETLASAYGLRNAATISLHNSGMNAVYAAIAAAAELQRRRGRRKWLQLGWIFFDTVKLFEKRIIDAEYEVLPSAFDVEQLAEVVAREEIAGIVTEIPSNPLMRSPDVRAIRAIADRAGCSVVLDATIGTPHNLDVLPYADVVCESLTKYATGSVDVLMGTTIVNPTSAVAEELTHGIGRYGEPPYHGDAARVADRLPCYAQRIRRVNENTMALIDYFSGQPCVRKVYWAYEAQSVDNYRRVERTPDCPGGLLMLDLRAPLERVYDRLAVAKGPSFGADFTMASPQVFIAHFDLLGTERGRSSLRDHGLHRDMLRVSVGTEDCDRIAAVFQEAFRDAQ